MFSIQNNKIYKGSNTIILSKDSQIDGSLIVLLSKNNNTVSVPYTIENNLVYIEFNITHKAKYEIFLKDNNEIYDFSLEYVEVVNTPLVKFSSYLTYSKGIVYLNITSNKLFKVNTEVNITGDLNKKIVWEAGQNKKSIPFVHLVILSKKVNYQINGQMFSQYVLDKDNFPTNLIKTSTGVKLNRASNLDLILEVDDNKFKIPAKTSEVFYQWKGEKEFKLYHDNFLIFSQKIKSDKDLPILIIATDPIRIKIGYPVLEKIEVKLKGYSHKFILEAGQTELPISVNKGVVEIEIEKATNVIVEQTIWRFINQ